MLAQGASRRGTLPGPRIRLACERAPVCVRCDARIAFPLAALRRVRRHLLPWCRRPQDRRTRSARGSLAAHPRRHDGFARGAARASAQGDPRRRAGRRGEPDASAPSRTPHCSSPAARGATPSRATSSPAEAADRVPPFVAAHVQPLPRLRRVWARLLAGDAPRAHRGAAARALRLAPQRVSVLALPVPRVPHKRCHAIACRCRITAMTEPPPATPATSAARGGAARRPNPAAAR